MASIDRLSVRVLTAAVAAAFLHGACTPTPSPPPTLGPSAPATEVPTDQQTAAPVARPGGTIYVLTQAEQWNQVDPQRVYTAEDLAFFGATTMRALTAFKAAEDPLEGTTLVPDMATDLGTVTDGGRVWSFTLRPGVTWQDGAEVTCEDISYGVSRTFAVDVINQGPTYAISYLDIPTETDGSSEYKGPYSGKGQDLYDAAVTCADRTITFHLNRPVVDFNETVTLGFGAVRRSDDTGETYGLEAPYVQSDGPYQVERYSLGSGGRYVLARNPNWEPASDPIRKAYPDRWEVDFGVAPRVIDDRIMQARGNDASAIQYGNVQPANLGTVFTATGSATAPYAGRAIDGLDPYVRFYWINVQKVPNVKVRQALMVGLDRAAIRESLGGEFFGAYADGVIKPTVGADYAPTGIWDTFFGRAIPPGGDPELARKLMQESGDPLRTLTFMAADTPTNQRVGKAVVDSLARAGITVRFDPLEPHHGYGIQFDDDWETADFATGGWGADWPSASTVIPPLFTKQGSWDLSQVDDQAFNKAVDDALVTSDPAERAHAWQALNRTAIEQAWVIPTFFGRSQTLGGTKVAPLYRWPAYQSWPYAEMFVTP